MFHVQFIEVGVPSPHVISETSVASKSKVISVPNVADSAPFTFSPIPALTVRFSVTAGLPPKTAESAFTRPVVSTEKTETPLILTSIAFRFVFAFKSILSPSLDILRPSPPSTETVTEFNPRKRPA